MQPYRRPYSFVTVAHAEDDWLLRLQARSMRLYLPPAMVEEIVVVENSGAGRHVGWRDRLRLEYGDLAGRVRFLSSEAIAMMPAAPGWWTQQVLKILVHRVVACDRYVVLDAKNHLIRPLHPDFLEAADGRMLSRRYCYRAHPLRHFLENTLRLHDLPVEPHVGWFMQADTPFTVDRSDARSAVAFLEARTAKSFAERLIEAKVTEFFVLAADLMRRGILEDRYDFSRIACPVVWDNPVEPGSLAAVIGEAEDSRAPIFSVHRRTLANMNGNTRSILCEFWQRHGLFGSTQEAMADLALHDARE
ncbi:DUF6492 family protein [Lichenicoccus roseus]|uniref:Uncharacterized protein n=1 Tax=Lichenicoccus roseus TaxID=2683649 RepID=A0A5R9JGL6_9PROT|nr:DUF6492 family protein [Lichenicoccus roseus]TLU74566.1 hypothetical protein FE263_05220 [Lichenicoccus roseus]